MNAVTVHPAVRVEPIEADGKWWVTVTVNSQPLTRRGPFANADKAKAAADRIAKEFTPAVPAPTNNDFVVLHGKPVKLDSDEGRKFVTDCVRAGEKLVSDSELMEIYEIAPENWAKLDKNPALIKAVRDERKRRVRTGIAAREAAQQHFVKAPEVLNSIMSDAKASPRHRIESAREIRQVAIGGDGAENPAGAAERFSIVFHLGSDVERIEKVIEHKPKPQQLEGEIDASE